MTKPMLTMERIIDIAGDIFGREGYKAATIRKIADAAHANIAAVNYHFQGKEGLYRAVLEDIFSRGFKKYPSVPPPGRCAVPEERLYIFIHDMFHRLLGRDGWGGFSGKGRLIARELLDPTPAFENIVETYIKPFKNILTDILTDLSKGKIRQDKKLPCAVSIIGQCVYCAFAGPVLQKIAKDLTPAEENLDLLTDHVFQFSLGGIQRIINHQEKHP